jgi:hypothetical protein
MTNQVPIVITDVADLEVGSSVPLQTIGSIGDYAVTATDTFLPGYYKRGGPTQAQTSALALSDNYNTWVQVGSDLWKTSWATIQGTATPTSLTQGQTIVINGITVNVPATPQNTVDGLADAINGAGITGLNVSAGSFIANGNSNIIIGVSGGPITGSVRGNPALIITGANGIQQSGVAIGQGAGQNPITLGIAIGNQAGASQMYNGIAIGDRAGYNNQDYAIAIGTFAGSNTQNGGAVAIGDQAGQQNQGFNSIAIGRSASRLNQANGAIAIGHLTGNSQGQYSIAIGTNATANGQATTSIVLNGTNQAINATQQGFYVDPVRLIAPIAAGNTNSQILTVNSTTNEITVGVPQLPNIGGNTSATSAAGGTPRLGMMYYDTNTNFPRMWNGSFWAQINLS